MSSLLVTVVIPSYNHEKFIGKAIESVLGQTYDRLEIIIIDDGSRDNSREIIKSYQDPRILFIEQENHGAHNAINRGIAMSHGDYISILNSDDEYHPDRIRRMVAHLTENTNSGLVCSYIEIVDSKGKLLGIKEGARNLDPWPVQNEKITFKAVDCLPLNLLMSNFISTTSNMFFRRSLWEAIGPFRNLRYAHDWDFAFRSVDYAPIDLIPEPLLSYRIHDSNTIRENKPAMVYEIIWVLAENLHMYFRKEFVPFVPLDNPGELGTFLERFYNSIYVYGCDKELFTMMCIILAARGSGDEKFSEILLEENNPVRQYLLKQISKKLKK